MSGGRTFYVNPVQVCSELYGYENVNDVRDCVMNSIRRYYGQFCDFHQTGLQRMIECYMVQILENAGRNPKAVKLALPPSHLQPRFFVERYFQLLKNNQSIEKPIEQPREQAYQQCLIDCNGNGDCRKNCYVDMKAMNYY